MCVRRYSHRDLYAVKKIRLPKFEAEEDDIHLDGQVKHLNHTFVKQKKLLFCVGKEEEEEDLGTVGGFPVEASVLGEVEVETELQTDKERRRRTVELGVFVDSEARRNLAEAVGGPEGGDGDEELVVEHVLATINQVG